MEVSQPMWFLLRGVQSLRFEIKNLSTLEGGWLRDEGFGFFRVGLGFRV